VVPWLGVGDEMSSSVLYTLERSDDRLEKACKYSVAIVESAEHELHVIRTRCCSYGRGQT